MAGFSSIDDMVAEITAGKFLKMQYYKSGNNGTLAAGYWAETLQWTGNPAAMTITGTAGTGVALSDATANAWYKGGNKTADTMHILNMLAWTPTTTMCPATLILCDFLAMYPSLVVTGTPSTITPVALTRYTDGLGVELICSVASALGATAPTLTFSCKDEDNNTRVSPAVMTPPLVSASTSTLFQDTAAGGSPFMRKFAGKNAVKTLESYTLATGTTGTVTAFLVKPLCEIPILALNTPSERDYVYQLPSLPRIYDGACLGFIVNVGGAFINLGRLNVLMDVAWG